MKHWEVDLFFILHFTYFLGGRCAVRTHPTHPLPIRACHLSTAAHRCSGFAAVGPAGRRYRSIAAAAGRRSSTAARRSKTNASSVTLSADVGSSRTDLFVRMRNVNERVISAVLLWMKIERRQRLLQTRRAAIYRYRLPAGPTAGNPPHRPNTPRLRSKTGQTDRQTDGHSIVTQTLPHTMRTVSIG